MRRALAALVAGVVAVLVGFSAYWLLSGDDAPPPPRLDERAIVAPTPTSSRWKVAARLIRGLPRRRGVPGWRGRQDRRRPDVRGLGRLEVDDGRIVSALLEADLTQLRSDQSRRDDALRTRGIETARFPTARFSLLEPVALGKGERARGLLLLHDHRAPVTVRLDSALTGSTLELVGSAPIDFEDFAIEPPSVAGLVSVRSHGTLEFRLLARQG